VDRKTFIDFAKGLARPVVTLLFPKLVYRRRLSLQDPEREMDLLSIIVPKGREAIDVGANIGAYAFALSSLARHVLAFEPNPMVASFISRVLPKNVTVRNLAVSDTIGTLDLFVPTKEGREDTTSAHIAGSNPGGGGVHYKVHTATLDSFADRDIGFLKIDVEGHELNVLSGAQQLIAKQRPTILIEAEDRHRENAVQDVFRYFLERNYKGFFVLDNELMAIDRFEIFMQDADRLRKDVPRRQSAYVNNFIFVPAERCNDDLVKTLEAALR
jgi:FkbM family methyltransferase